MSLHIYNSYSGEKEEFKPTDPGRVRIYNCGPTVYNFNHIGNFRSYIFVDIFRRYLAFRGYGLDHTMNITDVDDKIIDSSLKEKKTIEEFTAPFIKAFLEDIKTLKIQEVEHRPKATESIPRMIDMVQEMERQGHTYNVEGNIYFRLRSFSDYGKLSRLDQQNLLTAADGRFEADEYTKEDARDFALWKIPVRADEPSWDSPWGKGRPGWHLECSAMIRDIYGKGGIDIHLGGIDLLFPHHENEIAQSRCAYPEEPFVRYWMHNEHLLVNGKKMSKSLGNYYTLRDLTRPEDAKKLIDAKRAPEFLLDLIQENKITRALRYLLLSFQYRTKLNFTFENLKSADASCDRIQHFTVRLMKTAEVNEDQLRKISMDIDKKDKEKPGQRCSKFANKTTSSGKAMNAFIDSMDDDINSPRSMAAVFDYIHETNLLIEKGSLPKEDALEGLLFLFRINEILDIISFTPTEPVKEGLDTETEKFVRESIEKRNAAKKSRDFALADKIRADLMTRSIRLVDTPDGTTWEKVR